MKRGRPDAAYNKKTKYFVADIPDVSALVTEILACHNAK